MFSLDFNYLDQIASQAYYVWTECVPKLILNHMSIEIVMFLLEKHTVAYSGNLLKDKPNM